MARCDHLFVYGTLMSAAKSRLGRGERARLFREGRSLGAAFARGRLYELGRYPGMTDPHGPRELVHGEVVRLDDPSRSFSWLDEYEGLEYTRVERRVWLASGDDLSAALYLYGGDLARARHLPDGRWATAFPRFAL